MRGAAALTNPSAAALNVCTELDVAAPPPPASASTNAATTPVAKPRFIPHTVAETLPRSTLSRVQDDTFDVVFVCTGNQFRSPLAAAVFERETTGRPVRVSSCGTSALEGGAFREAVELFRDRGIDLSEHRSRRLPDLAEADLVLGFERHHVERAVVQAGAPRERAFTLPQVVELLESGDGMGGPRERIAALRPGTLLKAPEVEDPIGLPKRRQQAIFGEVEDLARRLAAALFS